MIPEANYGLIVGQIGGRYLMHRGSHRRSPHGYVAAPTGSGKTQALVLPNALNWPGSMVVLDLKAEVFERTAGYRAARGQAVHALNFAPRDYRGDLYNPFFYVSDNPDFRVADIEKIADYLVVAEEGKPFWANQGRSLFIGLALYIYGENEKPGGSRERPTLPAIRNLVMIHEGLQTWCREFIKDTARRVGHHPECLRALSTFATSAEDTANSTRDTLASALKPLVSDLSAAVLSGNTFDLRELRKRPMTVYVIVNPADRAQIAPMLQLFFQQMIDVNTDIEFGKDPSHLYRVLGLLDEFTAPGAIRALETGVSFVRSYGFTFYIFIQSPSQLYEHYKRDPSKAFTDNFGVSVFMTPAARDTATAEAVSKLLGTYTVKSDSTSRPLGWFGNGRPSVNTSDQKRALMLPQEVMMLPEDEVIIVVSGVPPIRAKRIFTAKDPILAKRYAPPPTLPLIVVPRPVDVTPQWHKPTAADIPNLYAMRAEDIKGIDFSGIVLPGEPMSEADIDAVVALMVAQVRKPRSAQHAVKH